MKKVTIETVQDIFCLVLFLACQQIAFFYSDNNESNGNYTQII